MSGDGDDGSGSSSDRDTESQRGISSAYSDMAASMSGAGVRGMDGRGSNSSKSSSSFSEAGRAPSENGRVSGGFDAVSEVNSTPSEIGPGFSAFDGLDNSSGSTANAGRTANDRVGGAFDAVAEVNPGTATARSTDTINDRIGQTFDVVAQPGVTREYQRAGAGLTNAGITSLSGNNTLSSETHQRGLLSSTALSQGIGNLAGRRSNDIDVANSAYDKPAPNKANYDMDTMAGKMAYGMDYYDHKGVRAVVAAGLLGNFAQESGLRTGAVNPRDGRDGSNSIGIGQWNGDRAKALGAFAAANNRDPNDFDTQLDFGLHELQTDEVDAHKDFQAATTVEQATIAGINYERPSGWTSQNPKAGHGFDNRLGYAQQAYDLHAQQRTAPPTSPPASQAPAPQPAAQPSAPAATSTPAAPAATPAPAANTNQPAEPETPTPQRGILGNVAAGVIDIGTGLVPGVGAGIAVVNGGVSLATGRSIGQHVVDGIISGDFQPGNQNPEAVPSPGNGESGDHFLSTYLEPEEEDESPEGEAASEETVHEPSTYDPGSLNSLRPTPDELWGRRTLNRRALSA